MHPRFSLITATIQRSSLITCCESINKQTYENWEHVIMVDREVGNDKLLRSIAHPKRKIYFCPTEHRNFGNTCRHLAWEYTSGDVQIVIDDDNHLARNDALEDVARCLRANNFPDWAVFPILRFGQRFFSDDPRCCHIDTANLVIKREIARWPDRPEYTLDGIFCEELKAKYPYSAFPDVDPIIVVPVMNMGQ